MCASPWTDALLQREVLLRKDEPIGERVLYDDVNEFFWHAELLVQLLPPAEGATGTTSTRALRQQTRTRRLSSTAQAVHGTAATTLSAYNHLRGVLTANRAEVGGSARHLETIFTKQYIEQIS